MPRLSRRDTLKFSLGLGAATLALSTPLRAFAAGDTLRVTHFGGPYVALESIIGDAFVASGAGEVEYEQDQPNLILAKWQAQPDDPAYDIGLLERAPTLRAGAGGLALPLTPENVPNLANALPGALADDGAGVALAFDTIDIMYDKNQVSEPITSWLDLWRPELAGKIMLPGMPIDGAIVFTLVAVARAMGLKEEQVEETFPRFIELKDRVHSFYSDPNQASQLLERGEIAAAVQYSARIGQLMKRHDNITRATPDEGVPAIPYDLVVAAKTKAPEAAASYVNLALTPQIQEQICSAILLNPSVSGVELSDETVKYIISDQSKMFAVNDPVVIDLQQGWLERWQREVQS